MKELSYCTIDIQRNDYAGRFAWFVWRKEPGTANTIAASGTAKKYDVARAAAWNAAAKLAAS